MAQEVKAAGLGERVREQRKAKGLSQEQLALRVHYRDKSMVSRIESGQVDLPLSKIGELSYALDISPYYLLGMTDDPTFDHADYSPKPAQAKQAVQPEGKLYKAYRNASGKTQQAVCLLLDIDPKEITEE